mmetsp:Transcript_5603/g.15304  ORF Transcript_5603/g.15304 Transcript_5603/m.15304 type:complete len:245 (-) Transcript_5603:983-1717(-)
MIDGEASSRHADLLRRLTRPAGSGDRDLRTGEASRLSLLACRTRSETPVRACAHVRGEKVPAPLLAKSGISEGPARPAEAAAASSGEPKNAGSTDADLERCKRGEGDLLPTRFLAERDRRGNGDPACGDRGERGDTGASPPPTNGPISRQSPTCEALRAELSLRLLGVASSFTTTTEEPAVRPRGRHEAGGCLPRRPAKEDCLFAVPSSSTLPALLEQSTMEALTDSPNRALLPLATAAPSSQT